MTNLILNNMTHTHKEYLEAKNIIKVFEKERESIKIERQRRQFNYFDCKTYSDLAWLRKIELNKIQYEFKQYVLNNKTNDPFLLDYFHTEIKKYQANISKLRKNHFIELNTIKNQ